MTKIYAFPTASKPRKSTKIKSQISQMTEGEEPGYDMPVHLLALARATASHV